MARPLADDLRRCVVRAVESGMTQVEVAETFGLGVRTVGRYLSRWRENGQFARGKFGGHKKHLLAAHAEQVRQLVTAASRPDAGGAVSALGGAGNQGQQLGAGPLPARERSHL